MKTFLGAMAVLLAIGASAGAETRYDRNLEKAVKDIVAGKIGGIRGGFSYKQVPQLVVLPDAAPAPVVPIATEPHEEASGNDNDGLMPAVERQVSRTIF
ncbi:hypothetical protein [Mesorhizobium sp.]|uniref:hypothetical protein n=1 Tax=Mesorhizobium sp. TaxID=1871066 RepID=UPI003BAD8FF4